MKPRKYNPRDMHMKPRKYNPVTDWRYWIVVIMVMVSMWVILWSKTTF